MKRINISLKLVSLTIVALYLIGCGLQQTASAPTPTPGIVPAVGGYGGNLKSGTTFTTLLLISGAENNVIDIIGVACAPNKTLASLPFTIASNVEINDGKFSTESKDVVIKGEFVSPTKIRGTLRALTKEARDCLGIRNEEDWVSECDLTVRVEPREEVKDGGVIFGNSSLTTANGTSFAKLTMLSEGGDAFIVERIETGSCVE